MKLIEILTLSTFAFSMISIGIFGFIIMRESKKHIKYKINKWG